MSDDRGVRIVELEREIERSRLTTLRLIAEHAELVASPKESHHTDRAMAQRHRLAYYEAFERFLQRWEEPAG